MIYGKSFIFIQSFRFVIFYWNEKIMHTEKAPHIGALMIVDPSF